MFSSELQLSSATAKLFHLEQFAIYGTVWRKILTGENFDEWASGKILTNSIRLTPTFINGNSVAEEIDGEKQHGCL